MPQPASAPTVFRVDKFAVPRHALPAFIERVCHIDQLLAAMPGCRQNLVLTGAAQGDEVNVVTLVEWASTEAMAAARAAVQARYAEEGFDPSAFMRQLGVRADMGTYGLA